MNPAFVNRDGEENSHDGLQLRYVDIGDLKT